MTQQAGKSPTATIETTEGNITVQFWPDVAPGHVNNFVELSKKGFYNGLIFHRVIPNFMIQGGCPQGTGTGSNGNVRLKAEFNNRPDRRHTRGVLSMARSSDPDSANSQFFIMFADGGFLDGNYTVFGKVDDEGMFCVDRLKRGEPPETPDKMVKVTVQ